jgi:hypothetical protein
MKTKRPYKAYKFRGVQRVKGPDGLDVHVEKEGCAGCTALHMNIAYEQGRKDERNHRRN